MIPAFSPSCQHSPPSTSRIKGGTGSDTRNHKSARESLGSSCLSPSCTLMSTGRAGDGFSLCLRASSGAGTLRSAAFTGKTLPSQAPKNPPQNRRAQVDPEDGDGGWMGNDDGWLLQSLVAESPSDLSKHLPLFPLMHFGVDV